MSSVRYSNCFASLLALQSDIVLSSSKVWCPSLNKQRKKEKNLGKVNTNLRLVILSGPPGNRGGGPGKEPTTEVSWWSSEHLQLFFITVIYGTYALCIKYSTSTPGSEGGNQMGEGHTVQRILPQFSFLLQQSHHLDAYQVRFSNVPGGNGHLSLSSWPALVFTLKLSLSSQWLFIILMEV